MDPETTTVDRLTELRDKRDDTASEWQRQVNSIKQVAKAVKVKVNDDGSLPRDDEEAMAKIEEVAEALIVLDGLREKAAAAAESAAKAYERAEREERTTQFVQPLIDGFGTLSVANPKGVPARIALVNVENELNGAESSLAFAQSKVDFLKHLKATIANSGMTEEQAADFPDISTNTEGEKGVTIEIAKRSTRGKSAGGPRAGGKALMRITHINDRPDLIGKTYGTANADYASARELFKEINPEQFEKLEAAKVNNNSNYSAPGALKRFNGLQAEEVPAEATA